MVYFLRQSYPLPLHSLQPAIKAVVVILANSVAAPNTSYLPCLFLDSQAVLTLLEHYQLETREGIATLANTFLIFTENQDNEGCLPHP